MWVGGFGEKECVMIERRGMAGLQGLRRKGEWLKKSMKSVPQGLKPKTPSWPQGGAAKAAPFQSHRIHRINEFFRSLLSPYPSPD
jgi:hypothetical protein